MKTVPAITILSVWLMLCVSVPTVAEDTVVVSSVIDGDTFKLESGEKVRLIGIDTPETVDPRKPVEYFGPEAKAHLESLILGKTVKLVSGHEERDKYSRLLAYVYLGTININLKMIADGYAMAYLKYPCEMEDEFLQAELAARRAAIGMWASPGAHYQESKPSTCGVGVSVQTTPVTGEAKQEITVYITKSGKKYHQGSCRYLSKSKIPISLEDAKARGYGACKVCKPPK